MQVHGMDAGWDREVPGNTGVTVDAGEAQWMQGKHKIDWK